MKQTDTKSNKRPKSASTSKTTRPKKTSQSQTKKKKSAKAAFQEPELQAPLKALIDRYKEYFVHHGVSLDIYDPDQVDDFLENKIKPILLKGATVSDVNGVPKELLEDLYTVGRASFEDKEWVEAGRMFTFLTIQDHKDGRYAYAAGRCFENLAEFDLALMYYFAAVSADKLNPEYLYRLSYCLYISGDEMHAMDGFSVLITIADHDSNYKDLVAYARAMVEMIMLDRKNAAKGKRRAGAVSRKKA